MTGCRMRNLQAVFEPTAQQSSPVGPRLAHVWDVHGWVQGLEQAQNFMSQQQARLTAVVPTGTGTLHGPEIVFPLDQFALHLLETPFGIHSRCHPSLLLELAFGLFHVSYLCVPDAASISKLHCPLAPKNRSSALSGRIGQLVSQVRDLRLHLLLHLMQSQVLMPEDN